ncbi:AzlD domain-containing protein [Streptomyces sp. NBC_00249]|uniref:AzlD domain-containing protein n=1 Tax=Streptomyces sp. NBC_00249 TaxID=2975690 RepID=UPI00225312F8|nr:AzlD domain-containing protein [Streptomyces sp. NBC_00249]MCX5193511.1 AzlD domain-containing protein [Streptomyces sp. NBC_00249]
MALLILGMGLCSFLPRYLPLVLLADREMPATVKSLLGYTPPAVLAALVVPAMLTPEGHGLQLNLSNPYLIGGAATFVAGLISKRFLLVSAIGIAAFYLSRWLLG